MANFLKKLFGSSNEAEIKRLRKILDKVNALEPKMHALRDEELRALTPAFKDRLQTGETLDDLLPEAFAAVREAAVRALGQRPFDVQVLGAIVLHPGSIAALIWLVQGMLNVNRGVRRPLPLIGDITILK